MKLSELIAEFLKSLDASDCAQRTIEMYTYGLNKFLDFVGDIDLVDLTPALADTYCTKRLKPRKLASSTVAFYLKPIRSMMKLAFDRGYTTVHPKLIKLPPRGHGVQGGIMSIEDYKKMLWCARDLAKYGGWREMRNLTMLAFTGDTWCRLGGLMSLTFDRLDLAHKCAVLREKKNKKHTVYFGNSTTAFLKRWLQMRPAPVTEHGAVWVTLREGINPMTPRAWQDVCNALAKRVGVEGPHNPHSIRHMSATEASKNGIPVEVIKDKCGHRSSVTTIDYYLHTDEKRLRDATDDIGDILFGGDD
jgi:site-specific recombinase XerD